MITKAGHCRGPQSRATFGRDVAPTQASPNTDGADGRMEPTAGRILDTQATPFMPNASSVVHSDPDILGGTPVFVGTRVPVKSLYDYLEAGDSLDEFLESFPSVSREQAVATLELAREMTESHVAPAR